MFSYSYGMGGDGGDTICLSNLSWDFVLFLILNFTPFCSIYLFKMLKFSCGVLITFECLSSVRSLETNLSALIIARFLMRAGNDTRLTSFYGFVFAFGLVLNNCLVFLLPSHPHPPLGFRERSQPKEGAWFYLVLSESRESESERARERE